MKLYLFGLPLQSRDFNKHLRTALNIIMKDPFHQVDGSYLSILRGYGAVDLHALRQVGFVHRSIRKLRQAWYKWEKRLPKAPSFPRHAA